MFTCKEHIYSSLYNRLQVHMYLYIFMVQVFNDTEKIFAADEFISIKAISEKPCHSTIKWY